MTQVRLWRALALLMTVVALAFVTVALAGASESAAPRAQEATPTPSDTRYQWTGAVVQAEKEASVYGLKTECGAWLLKTESDATSAAVKKYVGQKVMVWGKLAAASDPKEHRAIVVESVFGSGDVHPELFVPSYCDTASPKHKGRLHPDGSPQPQMHPQGGLEPTLFSLLQRLAGAELKDLTLEERFDHFLGLKLRVLDKTGAEVEIEALPGVVVSNDGKSLVLDPNGPAEAQTFSLEGVHVLHPGGGGADKVQAKDKAVAVLKDKKLVVLIASTRMTVWPGQRPQSQARDGRPGHGLAPRGMISPRSQGAPEPLQERRDAMQERVERARLWDNLN